MTNNLISISEFKGEQVVSARELHQFLDSKQDFSTWIKSRIEKYGFEEGLDFTTFHKVVERAKRIEYALTTNTAKEIAMVEGNEKGKQARQYFIECEKAALAIHSRILSRKELLLMNLEAEEKMEKAQAQLAIQEPKVLFANAVAASKSSVLVAELAKVLKQNSINIGGIRLFEWLRYKGYLISRKGTDYNMPTQRSMNLGLFEIKLGSHVHADGHTSITKTAKVTGKGQVYFVNKFLNQPS
jgi:anti-repressor protein